MRLTIRKGCTRGIGRLKLTQRFITNGLKVASLIVLLKPFSPRAFSLLGRVIILIAFSIVSALVGVRANWITVRWLVLFVGSQLVVLIFWVVIHS